MQVFRSFAVDAVASMSSSCGAIAGSGSASERLHALLQLVSDSALSWLLISLNSLTMMTQAIIYSVALNSGKNELVALMIATSFMEVKVRVGCHHCLSVGISSPCASSALLRFVLFCFRSPDPCMH